MTNPTKSTANLLAVLGDDIRRFQHGLFGRWRGATQRRPPSRCSPPTVAPRRRRSGINLQRPSPAASALGGNHKRAARGPQNPGSPAPAARWPGSPGPNLLSPPSGCRRGGAALPRQYRGPTQTRLGTLRASWSLLAAAAGASVKYSRATSTEGAEVHFIDLKDRQG